MESEPACVTCAPRRSGAGPSPDARAPHRGALRSRTAPRSPRRTADRGESMMSAVRKNAPVKVSVSGAPWPLGAVRVGSGPPPRAAANEMLPTSATLPEPDCAGAVAIGPMSAQWCRRRGVGWAMPGVTEAERAWCSPGRTSYGMVVRAALLDFATTHVRPGERARPSHERRQPRWGRRPRPDGAHPRPQPAEPSLEVIAW